MVTCQGMQDYAFGDCLAVDLYKAQILDELGVNKKPTTFRKDRKWSDRISSTFMDQCKPCDKAVSSHVKHAVADTISNDPKNGLNNHKRNSIDALVLSL